MEKKLVESRLSMTNLMQDEYVELPIAHCSAQDEFTLGVKSLAIVGYMIPLAVLQYCFEGGL